MSTPLHPMPPTFEDALEAVVDADHEVRRYREHDLRTKANEWANTAEEALGLAASLAGDDPVKLARLAVVENRRQWDAYGVTLRPNEDALIGHIERLLNVIDDGGES